MTDVLAGTPAPDVPAAPAADAAPAPESTADQGATSPEQGQPETPKGKTFEQAEVDRIVAKRLSQESKRLERVARAEAEAAFLRQQLAERDKPTKAAQPQGAPRPEDFKDASGNVDYDKFLDATVDYRLEQRLSTREQESQAQREQRQATERAEAVKARLSAAQEKYEDFDDVALAPHVPITEAMAAFIAESDLGGDLAYHLGTNLEEAKRISRLSPAAVFRELVKLESTLTAPPETTKAPPPIKPNGATGTVDKDISRMSDKEYAEYRRRQIAQRR